MTSNPRDMRDWMRQVERLGVQQRGIPAMIQGSVEIIRNEQQVSLTRHPAAPVELTYQTAVYTDPTSRRRVRFLMDFPDVVFNTDGSDAEIRHYELWAQEATVSALGMTSSAVASQALPGATLPGLASTPSNEAIAAEPKPWQVRATNTSSFFRADGFIPGSVWRFKARAMGVNSINPGEFSAEIVVQMLTDTQPPPQPTAPNLLIQRGTITASWDGQSVSGPMPADFKYAILAHGTASSPTFEIARFGRGGGFKVVADIDYYDPQFFRIAAVDESGNLGPWSEQAVGFTTPLVDRDIILSTIDAAKTHLKNIDAGVSILPNTIITEHLVVTEEMTAAIANFLVVNADMINANSIWADEGFFGLADALLFRGDAFEGRTFTGGTFTGPTFQTSVEEFAGVRFDTAGIRAYSPGGTQTFSVSAATGLVTTVGRFYTGSGTSPFVAIIPADESYNGTQLAVLMAKDSAAMAGTDSAGMWVIDATATTAQLLRVRGLNGGGVNIQNGLQLSGANTTMSSGTEIGVAAGGDVQISAGAGNTINFLNNGAAYAMTSSSPANVYMHSTGQLFKSTSSLRYKTDVQAWDPGYGVLEMETFSWVDRNPTDPDDPLKRYYGHIAEQVAEVMPELATFNEDGLPESVQYERVGPALIPVVRDLLRRIELLEGA